MKHSRFSKGKKQFLMLIKSTNCILSPRLASLETSLITSKHKLNFIFSFFNEGYHETTPLFNLLSIDFQRQKVHRA